MIEDKVYYNFYKKNTLLEATVSLTDNCNLNCIHCFNDNKYLPKKELTLNEIKNLFSSFVKLGCLEVKYSGGEPTIRKDFIDIVSYANEKGFIQNMVTNGTLLTEKLVKKISQFSHFRINVSLYGATSEIHDSITQMPGSFDKAYRGICLLKDYGFNPVITVIVMKPNYDNLGEIYSLADKLGLNVAPTPILFCTYSNDTSPLEYLISDKQLEMFIKKGYYSKDPRESNKIKHGHFLPCNAGRTTCTIGSHGQVYPCDCLHFPVGNICEDDFETIWLKSEGLKKVREWTGEDFPKCSQCELLNEYCQPCPGVSFLEYKDPFRVPWQLCRLSKALKKYSLNQKKEVGYAK